MTDDEWEKKILPVQELMQEQFPSSNFFGMVLIGERETGIVVRIGGGDYLEQLGVMNDAMGSVLRELSENVMKIPAQSESEAPN